MSHPVFSDRELNGETLLREIGALRSARVPQVRIHECALLLEPGLDVPIASERLRSAALGRFADEPSLAQLLTRWAARLRTPEDVRALTGHLRRLALSSALIRAMWVAAPRLHGGGTP
ncbi:MAG: hypothetical protein ACKVPX_10395 [Myxococcaceae bacterium]